MSTPPKRNLEGKRRADRDYPLALWQLSLVLREIAADDQAEKPEGRKADKKKGASPRSDAP